MEHDGGINTKSLREMIEELVPGTETVDMRPFGADEGDGRGDDTEKGFGYGKPLHIVVTTGSGQTHEFVFHTAGPDVFGHDRRSDRAQEMLLAADTFNLIPRHVRAIDVGAVTYRGQLMSLGNMNEFYLLTSFAPGAVYADDLRRIARDGFINDRDRRRCTILAEYLADLHARDDHGGLPHVYRRAIRDLVGHGEGIFGIIDGYPSRVDGVAPGRLQAIEALCCEWRWKLRDRSHRLARTHGDFHPFNILFDERDELALLDASRGSQGDPADDVSCLAINYVFFAVSHPESWQDALGVLWRRFWNDYLTLTGDDELCSVVAPFLAWRALVLANPTWYPAMPSSQRDALLSFAEAALAADRFDPVLAEDLFA